MRLWLPIRRTTPAKYMYTYIYVCVCVCTPVLITTHKHTLISDVLSCSLNHYTSNLCITRTHYIYQVSIVSFHSNALYVFRYWSVDYFAISIIHQILTWTTRSSLHASWYFCICLHAGNISSQSHLTNTCRVCTEFDWRKLRAGAK